MTQVRNGFNGFLEMQPPATLYVKLLILILVRRLIPRIHIQLIYNNSNKASEVSGLREVATYIDSALLTSGTWD